MTDATLIRRNTVKASFTLERTYPARPARVFKAFADEQAKARWFVGPPGWEEHQRTFDFRVDGQEVVIGRHGGGTVSAFYCTYHDIVPDQRIVYAYRMTLDGVPISSSLTTLEIRPEGEGAHVTLTEYGVYFDGYDGAEGREHGTHWLLDQLGRSLTD
jgi:uncharacterized protein YndB with AHSA1/START domain